MARFSHLGPLPIEEQADICKLLALFFNPLLKNDIKRELNRTVPESIVPLNMMDFFQYLAAHGRDLWPKGDHTFTPSGDPKKCP
jgi:hypothetical protein